MKLKPETFVTTYYPFAKETQRKKGIDARFILAQAALETGWAGKAPGNMFFGIKAMKSTVPSKKQLLTTTEILDRDNVKFPEIISIRKREDGKFRYIVKDWFRRYETPEESFSDHADFFFRLKRYAKALEVRHDPYLFADEIAKAGYATDPNYAKTLKAIIKTIDRYIPR